jgi:hypothetical protein
MKTPKLTPWQQWAQDYMAKRETDTGQPPCYNMDNEDADRYARAAWEECKKRCLQVIKKQRIEWDEWDDPYIADEATKEIKNL